MTTDAAAAQAPEKKKGGKKKLILAGIVGLVAVAAVAGQGNNPPGTSPNSSPAGANNNDGDGGAVTARLNQPVTVEGVTITIKKAETSAGTEFIKPAAGQIYIGYLINYKADDEEQLVNSSDWTALSDGTKQGQWTVAGNEDWQPLLSFDQLRPNAETEGWVVFEVPEPQEFVRLEFDPSFFSSESKLTFDATVGS